MNILQPKKFTDTLLGELGGLSGNAPGLTQKPQEEQPKGRSFSDYMTANIKEVNEAQKAADTMAVELASGKKRDIHETMLALTQAELSFNLMVQVRNKVLEAYQEVMRMQV